MSETGPMSDGAASRTAIGRVLHDSTDPAHHTWVRWLARFGYAARGAVYALIGGLTIYAAATWSEAIGKREALRDLVDEPFGKPLLIAILVGIGGYIVWRLIQSIGDTDDHGLSLKGAGVRLGLLVSAGTYAFLGYYVFTLLFQGASDGRSGSINASRGTINDWLNRDWVAYLVAAGFLIVAGAHIWKAIKAKYQRHFDVDPHKWHWIHPVSRTGLAARGVVLAVIGGLFAYRGWTIQDDMDDPPGLRDALRFIEDLPMGGLWLGLIGAGLLLFAGYSFIEAFFRRINVHEADSPKEQIES